MHGPGAAPARKTNHAYLEGSTPHSAAPIDNHRNKQPSASLQVGWKGSPL